jgi:hypothetical protein
MLLAAAGFAVIAGAAGLALAHEHERGEPRAHGLFQSDANSDGVLTRQEFDTGRTALFARLDRDGNGQLTREEMHAMRGEHRGGRGGRGMHLEGADANNDGNITREEFMTHPTEMFDRLDANRDGVIAPSERPQHGERRHGGPGGRAGHTDPDANSDGLVSSAEFTAMGAHLFDRLDANDDGRVTREEAHAGRPHRGDRD